MKLWGISWIEIDTTWTDDQWFAFLERAGERIDRENKSVGGSKSSGNRGERVQSGTPSSVVKKINEAYARKAGAVTDGD